MDDLELVRRDLAGLREALIKAEYNGRWTAILGIRAAIDQKESELRALAAAGEL